MPNGGRQLLRIERLVQQPVAERNALDEIVSRQERSAQSPVHRPVRLPASAFEANDASTDGSSHHRRSAPRPETSTRRQQLAHRSPRSRSSSCSTLTELSSDPGDEPSRAEPLAERVGLSEDRFVQVEPPQVNLPEVDFPQVDVSPVDPPELTAPSYTDAEIAKDVR